MRTEPTSAITTADPDSDNADLACLEDVAKATFMREHGTLSMKQHKARVGRAAARTQRDHGESTE
jgi:hypothetical protein